ncbi:1-deoxy-D-xylulose-5-phosphate synthase [Bifidobacterium sp. DSM 109957]|uniref:1-deoxy-D-xylulose-5-phosphate synthase n=2 Tax=Bifidobacterium oedipodis TaxID=2675322 RepID=A0A7Y0HRH7_9BIFI|nr:1-deoxy-D-xylulose-5-phosphate synthase [Bifidobacterium sp. DSM 109957]NMM94080.1 1-deoxy-D-xylulose-5-phosphate synthase [Bifidobacterium sp. DSM 109957]
MVDATHDNAMETTCDLLSRVSSPADVKSLSREELHELCRQIRATLLTYGHAHGGHIGSNLGVVELTVALHRVFDSPRDRIVFDVSHQSYVHKMLTGRAAAYRNTDRFGEVTGFTNPEESKHDQFVLGHTGTSISLACGLAKTRDMEGASNNINNVIAVIGDGSLSSGVAFEGLNNAAEQGGNMIIVINDNEMSIAGDFGGMYGPLARLRASGGTAQPNLFEAFGLEYRYVEQGNDVDALVTAFEQVRNTDHPVVVHVHTLKGAGFDEAQALANTHALPGDTPADSADSMTNDPADDTPWHSDHCNLSDHQPHEGQCEASHWQNPDVSLGKPDDPRKYYGKLAMAALESRFADEPGLVVVCPATPGSNGITHEFRERAGAHYVDTGITEQHAVAYAAGIARAGGTPVVCTTASFFQRAYDQFFQEMSLNRSRVTVLDFLGGLSGSDNTHSGAYDVTMFANIPGVTMLCPTSREDFLADLAWATMPQRSDGTVSPDNNADDNADVDKMPGATSNALPATSLRQPDGPVVIRIPGEPILAAERAEATYPQYVADTADTGTADTTASTIDPNGIFTPTDWKICHAGAEVAIVALGNAYPLAEQVVASLSAQHDIDATLIDPRQCSSLDERTLAMLRDTKHELVVTLEDGQLEGGWGEKVTAWYANNGWSGLANGGTAAGTDISCDNPRVLNFGATKEFTDRVPLTELNERYGLTPEGVIARILDALR